jgi:chemotaxis protein MotD
MIDGSINALVNAPYIDPKAGGQQVAKDDGGKGGFNDALSNVKDDKPALRDRVDQEKPQQGQQDEPNQLKENTSEAGDADTSSGLAARKLLEAMAAVKTVRTSVSEVFAKPAPEAQDGVKTGKPDRGKSVDGAKGGKNVQKGDEELTSAKPETDEEPPVDTQNLAPNAIIAALSTQSDSSISQIARAINNKDAQEDRPVRSIDRDHPKAQFSTKDTLQGVTGVASDTDTQADTGGDATFRFSSSKTGSARSMDMTIRTNEGRAEFEVKDNAPRITDNITVVDSRRYIGLATNTNASALTSLIAGDSEWASAMQPGSSLSNAAAQSSSGKVVHTLKLHMTPIELGSVTMSLRMVGDELAVHMTVENNAAYKKLQDDNKSMLDALKGQGLTVDHITISIASSEKSDQTGTQSNNQQNQAAQQNGQQAADGRNRGESDARDGGQRRGDITGLRDDVLEGPLAVAGAGLDAGVYL